MEYCSRVKTFRVCVAESSTMKELSLSLKNSKEYDYWIKKNWYYHRFLALLYKNLISPQSSVLQVGCKTGFLLAHVAPSYGVGIDTDSECIQKAQNYYSHLEFYHTDCKGLSLEYQFDYIILSSITMETDDIQQFLLSLQRFCHARTRIIIDFYSSLWEPVLWLSQRLALRRPTSLKNWISVNDMKNFLTLTDFETVTHQREMLLPFNIPGLSWLCNTLLAHIPLINRLCLNNIIVARLKKGEKKEYSVSVVITCKNERGNIVDAVQRCPQLGSSTELIFVDGHSVDGTYEEIKRVAAHYPEKNIRYFVQEGKGKGTAVHQAFARATGDILMIQDGDLTAPPEELPKFYNALVENKGEFINGSRLVYGMEDQAMRFLNLIANYLFACGFTWLLGQPIKDTLCGTKVLFKKDYEKIRANKAFFGDFDPYGDFDLLFGAAKQNLKIIDVPVHYKRRTYGTSQISRFSGGVLLLRMSWVAFRKFKMR